MEKNFNILYVDDEPQNLVAFKASFRRFYHIYTANSGLEGIEILRNHPIDLVISDHRMPQMTGVEFFERILHEFPDPIRMVLTGYADIHAIIDAINKGKVYYYIAKPWKHDELKPIIDNALETYSLKKENKALLEEKSRLLIQTERQEKEYILSRYETLKNQVNPHFLFNSLNTLAALIYEDPDLAEAFISKLTKVYRYVLEQKQEIVVAIAEELLFMENYVFLQQIRFGDSLVVASNLDEQHLTHFVPPLTIQLLVENAIKHNIVSREHPLYIDLYVEENYLVIRNNYQARLERVSSTGIGLQNLTERYSFLSQHQPKFYMEDGIYYAKVPLLEKISQEVLYKRKSREKPL